MEWNELSLRPIRINGAIYFGLMFGITFGFSIEFYGEFFFELRSIFFGPNYVRSYVRTMFITKKKTWSFLACSTWSGSLWLFHMWCMRYLSEFFWAHVHYVLWFKILSDPNFDKIWHFKIRQPTIPSSDHSNGRNWHFLLLLLSQMHAIFIEMVSQLQTNRNELNSNKTVLSITNL